MVPLPFALPFRLPLLSLEDLCYNNIMKPILALLILFLLLLSPCLAAQAGFGINYGLVNNFRMWDAAALDHGDQLRVDYSYALNDSYTLALQVGFFADHYIFNGSANNLYVQTAAFLNLSNQFYLRKLWQLAPYLKADTGLYGVNSWYKRNNKFYSAGTNVMADVGVGAGADFNLWNVRANLDLTFPALAHVLILKAKLPYIISFGVKMPLF